MIFSIALLIKRELRSELLGCVDRFCVLIGFSLKIVLNSYERLKI